MINYYQKLLEECISIERHKRIHQNMELTLLAMKRKLEILKGVK